MDRPSECKWCGCGDIERESPIMQSLIVSFACGTMSDTDASGTRWLRDQRCAGPVGKLYKRIQRAVEVLERAERYEPVIDQHGGIDWLDIPEGTMMLSEPVGGAIAILKGVDNGETE